MLTPGRGTTDSIARSTPPIPAPELRPYQRECIARIRQAHSTGKRRVLVSLPTGTGKTVVFASFPKVLRMKKKLLILAHREELIDQAAEKLQSAAPDLEVGIEQGTRRASSSARVVIGSVPTLGRAGSARLAALSPEDFSIIVVDEAHHAVATTYRRVLDHFRLFDPGDRFLVGFTATPRRGDGEALGKVFEEIVYARGIEEMIREGWLSPIVGWRVRSAVDLDVVRVRHGDFVEGDLAEAVNIEERNRAVVESYKRYAEGRRAIVFCVDVAHTKQMAEAFINAGIGASPVWGAMPRDDRRDRLQALREGTTKVLTNCQVLTEGFDEPRVECVIMARPTKSRLLYAQMVGRGTRLSEGKHNLVVIDVVDNSEEHALAGLHELFDLPEKLDLEGMSALRAMDVLRDISNRWPWIDPDQIRNAADIALLQGAMGGVDGALEIVAERIHFFSFEPPQELRYLTGLAWHAAPGGDFALSLGDGEHLTIGRTLLGWELTFHGEGKPHRVARSESLDSIVQTGDGWVHKYKKGCLKLVDLMENWRDLPATDKQMARIRKSRVPTPKDLTRGQATWIISQLASGVARRET